MKSQGAHQQHAVNYYQILGLTQPTNTGSNPWSNEDLKTAYHRTLLLHHPDKAVKHTANLGSEERVPRNEYRLSIDEIMLAYQTLADPKLKRDYDNALSRNGKRSRVSAPDISQRATHLGVETHDLDDLVYDEAQEQWTRSCRCGDEQGYIVTEHELERASQDGEVYVGCHGCSLFIKVLFGVTTEENDAAQPARSSERLVR